MRHIIRAQQFDREYVDNLCRLADVIRDGYQLPKNFIKIRTFKAIMAQCRAMLYFVQPSTRTYLSFTAALQILGIPFSSVRDTSTSSEVKGETEKDMIRTVSRYFDMIIIRHSQEGFVSDVADVSTDTSIINAGSGKDQHPTQALLDIYTLKRCFPEGLFGKTIAFVGDLKRGRTVRSLAYLLCKYPGVQMIFVAPPELQIESDILKCATINGIRTVITDDLHECLPECDAVYMTRLQDEHDAEGESFSIDYDRFGLTYEMKHLFKTNLAILHPLPRRNELDTRLDVLPQAKYWDQVENGMWMRAALIADLMGVSDWRYS